MHQKALISKANRRNKKNLSWEEVTLPWLLIAWVGGNWISSLPSHSASKWPCSKHVIPLVIRLLIFSNTQWQPILLFRDFQKLIIYLQLKAMNQSHQEGAEGSLIWSTEKPVSSYQTSCSSLKQASSEKGDWSPWNTTAHMKRIPPGLRERRLIQQVFYLSQISDTHVEVYNREELSKVRLSQTSFLS